MAKNNQVELATSLLEQFDEYGEAENFNLLDLLDNLASAGLKLVADEKGEASEAYIGLLMENAKNLTSAE